MPRPRSEREFAIEVVRTLRQAGMLAIYDGVTSIEEVVKETLSEDD